MWLITWLQIAVSTSGRLSMWLLSQSIEISSMYGEN